MKQKDKISIAGAGLVGSLLALYLARDGHSVEVYERRPDPRKMTVDGGRSINLALSDRGLQALEKVGLAERVKREMAIPMHRRVMHDRDGALSFQAYGKEGQYINSVSRAGLNALLMSAAEEAGVHFHFQHRCKAVDLQEPALHLQNELTGQDLVVPSDLIFGSDGAFSAVRTAMQKTDRFNYSQEYIDHGYKELTIPPGPDGSFQLEREALHIWPRGHYMLIALPNPDGSFTCTLFFPFDGEESFQALTSPEEARRFFAQNFADALRLMPDFDREWEENPASSMVIIRCLPWTRNHKVALIGDASHAIVPFYGQGMNAGFEDCRVLHDLMQDEPGQWPSILEKYERLRQPDADAIADLALRNFVEMRDLTGDPEFLLQKKIEAKLAERHPDKWIPLYSLVTFSPHIRYSEALARGKRQDRVMAQVMQREDIHQAWDSLEVEKEALALLEKGEA